MSCHPYFLSFNKARKFSALGARNTTVLATVLAAMAGPALAQNGASRLAAHAPGTPIIPRSSEVKAEDTGIRAHTNVRFLAPAPGASPSEAPPFPGYAVETPASLACVYRLASPIRSCNPNSTVNTPTGGSQTIAIVDAYDDPYAASDLAAFSDQFGLPFARGEVQGRLRLRHAPSGG